MTFHYGICRKLLLFCSVSSDNAGDDVDDDDDDDDDDYRNVMQCDAM